MKTGRPVLVFASDIGGEKTPDCACAMSELCPFSGVRGGEALAVKTDCGATFVFAGGTMLSSGFMAGNTTSMARDSVDAVVDGRGEDMARF